MEPGFVAEYDPYNPGMPALSLVSGVNAHRAQAIPLGTNGSGKTLYVAVPNSRPGGIRTTDSIRDAVNVGKEPGDRFTHVEIRATVPDGEFPGLLNQHYPTAPTLLPAVAPGEPYRGLQEALKEAVAAGEAVGRE